ncbi:HD domain-containing protein [Enteractinococcus helveticum]|uniref:Metal-dependent phosphohydrolase n=1 Tax=Enteractinococcus helveticum TaxID=1837282 RepID=A0A1B7M0X8_9MICC|nr:HD domain-containing protein [Enteractinococcus helveticum]OAV61865.1 metal-dependent phosphohydrolase [Enteractinococcus helveticum]
MYQKLQARQNDLGRDISDKIPDTDSLTGLPSLSAFEQRVWQLAAPHLKTRRNDNHSLFAYGIASALLQSYPDANPDVVLPAILLHDTGWSKIPDDEVLEAIAPGGGRKDLVLLHEQEGARIAQEILTELGFPKPLIDEITEIIDGHDSRMEALSLNDAIVKDADKIWRVTPAGLDVIMDWFGLSRPEALRLSTSRVHGYLLTNYGAAMAMAMTCLESMATTDEVKATLRP